jgi:hypothetical protein
MPAENQNSPQKQCDLVMKGGITSGVVYPPAVLKLKDYYRFRSIGGTSAGAIAATLTAAAEFGREHGGFGRFAEAQKKISSDKFILNLFQPSEEARPLMDTLLALMEEGKRSQDVRRQKLLGRLSGWRIILRDSGWRIILRDNHPEAFRGARHGVRSGVQSSAPH